MSDASNIILVCTVGGSPQPVASALRALRPERVMFVVSDGKGSAGSREQVEEREIVYDKASGLRGPGLRYAEGCPVNVGILQVPSDDPDRTYALCLKTLADLRCQHLDRRLIADYTGGTKSMTGGLLMAAFATEAVEVQFMLGKRPDIVQVSSGTEAPRVMSADLIQAERDFDAARQAVAGHDYAAACRLVGAIRVRLARTASQPPAAFKKRLALAERWSALMALWDAFQHKAAAKAAYNAHESGDALAEALHASGHYDFLQNASSTGAAPSWGLCADLWLNAQRRATRGRYDDALARLYRLVEAAAQAHLKVRFDLDSGHVPLDALPDGMRTGAQTRTDPRTGEMFAQLAQLDTYALLGHRDPSDPLVRAYAPKWRPGARLYGPRWLSAQQVDPGAWLQKYRRGSMVQASRWVEDTLRPFWSALEPPQLPKRLPEAPSPQFELR